MISSLLVITDSGYLYDIFYGVASIGKHLDTLNILYIINEEFFEASYYTLNPRNSMYISRNDGMFDNRLNHQRDVIINTNTFVSLGRHLYNPEELANLQKMAKQR